MSDTPRKTRRKNFLLERAEYALFRFVSWPLRHAGDARVDRWARWTARLCRRLLKSRDALALRNLRRVFPDMTEERREEIVDACWRHFARVVFEFIRGSGTMRERPLDITGYENVEAALALNRGVIIITAHYGDWESAIGALGELSMPVCVVARRLDNRLLERDLYRSRTRTNVEMVDRRKAARPLYRVLSSRGAVVILADQGVKPREGILVPFLGIPAWTTPAPGRLALKTGAPILFAWCEPSGKGTKIEVEPPLFPDSLSPGERSPEMITRRINDRISERIRTRPELWLWMHDRWKNTRREPAGDHGNT